MNEGRLLLVEPVSSLLGRFRLVEIVAREGHRRRCDLTPTGSRRRRPGGRFASLTPGTQRTTAPVGLPGRSRAATCRRRRCRSARSSSRSRRRSAARARRHNEAHVAPRPRRPAPLPLAAHRLAPGSRGGRGLQRLATVPGGGRRIDDGWQPHVVALLHDSMAGALPAGTARRPEPSARRQRCLLDDTADRMASAAVVEADPPWRCDRSNTGCVRMDPDDGLRGADEGHSSSRGAKGPAADGVAPYCSGSGEFHEEPVALRAGDWRCCDDPGTGAQRHVRHCHAVRERGSATRADSGPRRKRLRACSSPCISSSSLADCRQSRGSTARGGRRNPSRWA